MSSRIEDYGFISNMRTGALVSRAADIDWFCGPRFDSDACFAALLGYDEHGRWAINPTVATKRASQRYRGDTLILETQFDCEGGVVRVSDFMPVGHGERCDIVRIIDCIEGEVSLESVLDVRFGYGADAPWIKRTDDGLLFVSGPDAIAVRGPVNFTVTGKRAAAYLTLKKGQRVPMQLNWHSSHESVPPALDADQMLAETESYWLEWIGRCTYEGSYREAVVRSLLTLKGLTYEPTGAIIAALTTSLPEAIGGVRNWDYRFCWLRDASLTLDALLIGGYVDEARGFRDWLLRAASGDPSDIQIMYDIMGGRRLTEFELPWLPGYEASAPVRVGNQAAGQFQLDVYGEVLSCLYAGRKAGLAAADEAWETLDQVIKHIERIWQRPDDGIWEVRGGRRHFTHSKVMAWVAIDRSVRSIETLGMGGDEAMRMLPHLRALRERIHAEVCQRGFNPRIGAFTQSYGSDALDASVLVIPHVGFLPADDPRMRGTVAAIEKTLLRDGFVLRYSTEHGTDGLPGSEGAFLACSFWLADNYAFAGRIDDAERLFDRLLGLRNHLELLAEEYEPTLQRQIGNFPQAFSHLALIFTARAIDVMKQRGEMASSMRGTAAEQVVHH
jgi:GH15 family glucan-1,4-alpha-glucosidase